MIVRDAHGFALTVIPSDWLLARLQKLQAEGVPLSRAVLVQVARQWIEDERRELEARYHSPLYLNTEQVLHELSDSYGDNA